MTKRGENGPVARISSARDHPIEYATGLRAPATPPICIPRQRRRKMRSSAARTRRVENVMHVQTFPQHQSPSRIWGCLGWSRHETASRYSVNIPGCPSFSGVNGRTFDSGTVTLADAGTDSIGRKSNISGAMADRRTSAGPKKRYEVPQSGQGGLWEIARKSWSVIIGCDSK